MRLEHIAIQVKSIDDTVKWYQRIFDCRVCEPEDREKDPVLLYFLTDLAFAMFESNDIKGGNLYQHFGIEVTENVFFEYMQKVKNCGVHVRQTTHDFPKQVDTFYFTDINEIELEMFTKK